MANTLVYTLDGKIYINLTNRCTNDCIFCLRNDKDDVCGQTLWLDDENSTAQDVIEQFEKTIDAKRHRGIEAKQNNNYASDKNCSTIQQFNNSNQTPPHPNPLPQGEGVCCNNPSTDNSLSSYHSDLSPSEVIFCGYGEPMLKLDVLKEVAQYIKDKYPDTKIRVNTNGHANYVYKRNVVPELKGLVNEFSVSLNGENKAEYDEFSQPKFDEAYEEMKKFIKACSDEGISVSASVVDGYKGKRLNLKNCEKIAKDLGAKFRVREWIPAGYN